MESSFYFHFGDFWLGHGQGYNVCCLSIMRIHSLIPSPCRHGRDNKLIVWKLGVDDEARMSTTLPLDPSSESRPEPWMLHMLEVNTMNFCSFSYCHISEAPDSEILLAVPNTLASEAVSACSILHPLMAYQVSNRPA